MSLTIIGYSVLLCSLASCLFSRGKVWCVAILFSIFQASAAVLLGEGDRQTGINPAYVPLIIGFAIQIFAFFIRPYKEARSFRSVARHFFPMTCFVIWACVG